MPHERLLSEPPVLPRHRYRAGGLGRLRRTEAGLRSVRRARCRENTREHTKSPYYRSLNGGWAFHWARNPEKRPVGFEADDYDVSGWDRIPVPSNWEIEGYPEPIYPQQTGNMTDVRRIALADRSGGGLAVLADPADGEPFLEVSALHHTPFDLDGPRHPYEVKRRAETVLGVNHRQMGVGGNDSWGAPPEEPYLLHSGRTYAYGYRLRAAD
ncbi:beta-galactosidase small subunit-related protein [Streptomyces sp. NPDC003006]